MADGAMKRIAPKFTIPSNYTPASECFCVRFSPDDALLAASFANGAIHVYNCSTGKQEFQLNSNVDRVEGSLLPLPTTQLRWRPHAAQSKTKNVLISVNCETNGEIQHWHIKSGKCLHTITEPGNSIFCIDYFSDGSAFATAGRDRLVRIYDEATKRLTQTLEGGEQAVTPGHSNRVFSLKYHPDQPNLILTGGWDNTCQLWDVRKGHSVRSFWNCYLCGDAVDFSTDGKDMLIGSWRVDDSLQIWDFGTSKVKETIKWQSASSENSCMIFSSQFSRDPTSSIVIAGGSQENEAKLFDRSSGKAVAFGSLLSLPKPVFSVDMSPSSAMAAIGSADGTVRVVDVN